MRFKIHFHLLPTSQNTASVAGTPEVRIKKLIACFINSVVLAAPIFAQEHAELSATNTSSKPLAEFESGKDQLWQNGIGEGFRSGAQSITVSAGATYGIAAFGGLEAHDLALVSFTYGHMLGPVLAEGHWYRGNPEFRLELFTGAQFSPSTDWFVGLTPHLRYNFATGTHWIPFVDIGAGVTATGIGPPDLSGTFEFNLQGGLGVQWFVKENISLSLEARYVHWSCAGITHPNLGLNGVTGMLGLTFFF